jgi:hypothetical protein
VVARLPALLVLVALAACGAKSGSPEAVADAFADAYFRQMDQEKAREFTALGASTMLETEIAAVAKIRKDGYGPAEAASEVAVHRGPSTPRDQRIRVPYEIHVRVDGHDDVREADVELAKLEGGWKVVRVAVKPHP